MRRTIKVFIGDRALDEVPGRLDVIERYGTFVVAEATPDVVAEIRQHHLVEDITDQFKISLGGDAQLVVEPSRPDHEGTGRAVAHVVYTTGGSLPPGPHRCLVQFVGPIKPSWLEVVAGMGGEIIDGHAGFAVVVEAHHDTVACVAALPFVRWLGHLPPASQTEPESLVAPSTKGASAPPEMLEIEFFSAHEATAAEEGVASLGLRITVDRSNPCVLVVEDARSPRSDIRRLIEPLSRLHGVRLVRRRSDDEPGGDGTTLPCTVDAGLIAQVLKQAIDRAGPSQLRRISHAILEGLPASIISSERASRSVAQPAWSS